VLGTTEALRERDRSPRLPTEEAYVAPALADAHARLDESTFAAAWAVGRATSAEETVELAHALAAPSQARASAIPPVSGPAGGLSARELEVVALIAQGLTNRQISDRLIVSERTTHAHVRNILDKLGFASRTQIATWAVQHRITSTDSL
jgi:DNA-binding NarL/FixJ family response regulator